MDSFTLGLITNLCYRDWYDDGMSPSAAASRAIHNARE